MIDRRFFWVRSLITFSFESRWYWYFIFICWSVFRCPSRFIALVLWGRWKWWIFGRFWIFCYYFFGLEGLLLLFWKVGGIGASSIYFEDFLSIPGGLSLSFCVVSGYGDLWLDLESFAPVAEISWLIFWDVGRFIVFWNPIQLRFHNR